jgi:hypothetical protein
LDHAKGVLGYVVAAIFGRLTTERGLLFVDVGSCRGGLGDVIAAIFCRLTTDKSLSFVDVGSYKRGLGDVVAGIFGRLTQAALTVIAVPEFLTEGIGANYYDSEISGADACLASIWFRCWEPVHPGLTYRGYIGLNQLPDNKTGGKSRLWQSRRLSS